MGRHSGTKNHAKSKGFFKNNYNMIRELGIENNYCRYSGWCKEKGFIKVKCRRDSKRYEDCKRYRQLTEEIRQPYMTNGVYITKVKR